MIEFDVETPCIQWYTGKEVFLVQFYDGETCNVLRHPADRVKIQEWLDKPDSFRAWNSKFDLHWLESSGYTLPPEDQWYDGMVEARLIDGQGSVALKVVAGKLFGEHERDTEKAVKEWLSDETKRRRKEAKEGETEFKEVNYSDVPEELMHPYAEQDVILTRRACASFKRVFEANEDLQEVYDFERATMAALYAAEKRGIPIDEKAAKLFELELAENLEKIEADCIELAGINTFNPNSSKQIAEALKRRGADLSYVTQGKTGPSMNAENLQTVDDELAQTILKFRGEYKNLSNYVGPILHGKYDSYLKATKDPFLKDGRIHPNFNQVGAGTGRMSCSDPNIQNWPRDDLRLRYLLRAEPGHKLVTADLDSIELRLFAAYAGQGPMLEAILNGDDLHDLTAQRVGLGERKRANGVESRRQRGKTFNYAICYGAGIRSLRKTFGVSQDEARKMLQRYHSAFPEVSSLQSVVEWKLNERGYIKTAWGRRQHMRADEAYKAVNYLVQGTAADVLKAALIRLHKEGWPVVALVHDEILLHVPEDQAEEAKVALVEALTDHPRLTDKVPITAEGKIVDRWSEAKDTDFVPSFATKVGC
jgi:DNA polymerase-1